MSKIQVILQLSFISDLLEIIEDMPSMILLGLDINTNTAKLV